ncbi:ABC-2 type transport system permease protein [Paenibacillus sp. UNCCL117]|uniref:ABC transporter permease n=1 Tax=unclassified Paenibacillus TaxID=185978 RepID=UPI000891B20D|nr:MULTISPECIES: ABC-2 family transporter protein [unclassified Paenibacillus]SDD05680.1 ABC-2 type transport system permease protein [Paenibacillus sp. cl123]SFW31848.1 ABC-2 type transport system permease protein [Paenibacillus sp. UNCCL117]
MRVYLEFAKKSFQNSIVYRVDFLAGVLNAIVMIFVNIAIWRAIYEEGDMLEGVQFKILVTYVVLSFLLQLVYVMDEYFIEAKIRSGLISSDLLKPINFRLYVFFYNLGSAAFRVVMQFAPVLAVSIVVFKLLPPFSGMMLAYFLLSAALGFLVLYNLNFIVWVSSFWFYWTFSLVTIKDAAVMIFSGALVPIWLMPQQLVRFIEMTPFDSIFYIPIRIYLGMVPEDQILMSMLRQSVWVAVLFGAGQLLWTFAQKRLVVQGG